jgi:hypothetical protein
MPKELELYQAKRKIKLEGTSINKIKVLEYVGSCTKNKTAYYRCECSVCGSDLTVNHTNLYGNKHLHGCKDCSVTEVANQNRTHGFKNTHKTYKSWCKIKERCFSPNDISYHNYGAKGVTMHKSFVDSFMNFYNEVGEAPEDGQKWSIDRKDHTKGYEPGNLRWAVDEQQARNKGKYKRNSTGFTGVGWYHHSGGSLYAVAQWKLYENGKSLAQNKKFSVKKLGLLEAFAKACTFREEKIKELNSLGYGYADNHGK